ncbi:sortase A [Sinobacterium caligoides]|uniref:Sortase A n=1 Tax=Sinobacterium caligoides TaxID=933926 RepID=A0A3N2DQ23_9GAMM|nr:class GN sortase [Sinobacterium caligoides]ROS01880.1 sortase A [Sinobacterium caligoides]
MLAMKRAKAAWQDRRRLFARVLVVVLMVVAALQLSSGLYIQLKAVLAQHLIAHSWQQSLQQGGAAVKPWRWADTWPVARLQFPEHKVDLYVLEGSEGNSLAFGPGHMTASSAVGEGGTSVIAGHRDTHFHFFRNIVIGDQVQVTDKHGVVHYYRVERAEIVDSREATIGLNADVDQLLMVTCFPFDGINITTLRYQLVAKPVTT